MLLTIGVILASILLGVFALYKYMTGNQGYWSSRSVPLIKVEDQFSKWQRFTFQVSLTEVELKRYRAFKEAGIHDYGGIMEFRSPGLVIMDPELIRLILVKDFDHFVNRRGMNLEKSDPIFHDMLVNKTGSEWKDLRSTMSPTFTTGKIRQMFHIFQESSNKLAGFLRARAQEEGSVEIEFRDAFVRYALDVIASAAFGIESGTFQETDSQFTTYSKRFQNQFKTLKGILKIMLLVFMPKVLNALRIPLADQETMDFFSNVVRSSIKLREGNDGGPRRNDFLQLLIEAKKNEASSSSSISVHEEGEPWEIIEKDTNGSGSGSGESSSAEAPQQVKSSGVKKTPLTDDVILAQSILFFIGGFDTMETLLDFVVYELALNPEIQEKLYEEIESSVAGSNEGKLTYDILIGLEYLDKVISETLRKYPPGIRTERKCTKEYQIPNASLKIQKDDLVIIPIYGIHHDEEIWPEPEVFDPERFSSENKASRNPYVYLPFGAGQRNCIANRFALLEGKAAICELVHKFKLEPCSRTHIPMKYDKMSIKPAGNLWLKVTPRT